MSTDLMDKIKSFMAARPEQYPDGKVKLNLTEDQKKQTADLAQSIRSNNPEHEGLFSHIEETLKAGVSDIGEVADETAMIPLAIVFGVALLCGGRGNAFM